MNHLLTGEGNGDTAYNRVINKELGELIDDEDLNEDFIKVLSDVKALIEKKEGIANPDELKKRISDIIYQNKRRLPSFEYFNRTLKMTLFSKHKRMDLNPEWGEKELQKNIDICLNQGLNTSGSSDNLVKEIIVYEIMRQGFEFKRKNEESLNISKNDTAQKIIHTLDIVDDEKFGDDENISNEQQLEIEFPSE